MVKKNKKGQGMSVEILVLLAVAVGVGVLLFWGFYTNWTFITSKTDVLPSDLALKAEACKLSSSNQVAYCDFGKPLTLSGVNGDVYVNCEYNDPNFRKLIDEAVANAPPCETGSEERFCVQLRGNANFKRAVINSFSCTPLLETGGIKCDSPGSGNAWLDKDKCLNQDVTHQVTDKKDFNDHIGQICCKVA